MPKLGRPPIPPEQRRTETLRMRLTETEMAAVEAAGGTEWARELVLRAAKRKNKAG